MQFKSCWLYKHRSKKLKTITEEDVLECQKKWMDAIKNISYAFLNNDNYILIAKTAINDLYAYDFDNVMFKPTKASIPVSLN